MKVIKGRTHMSQAEYSRHRGCSREAVRRAIKEGRIIQVQVEGEWLIDVEVADILWAQNTRARVNSGRSSAANRSGEGVGSGAGPERATGADSAPVAPSVQGYSEFRALEAQEDLRTKRRNNLLAEGQLTEVIKVRQGVFDAFRALRDKCFNVGPRAAPRCIGLGDSRDIEHVITEEIRQAFAGWEEQMNRKIPAPEGSADGAR